MTPCAMKYEVIWSSQAPNFVARQRDRLADDVRVELLALFRIVPSVTVPIAPTRFRVVFDRPTRRHVFRMPAIVTALTA